MSVAYILDECLFLLKVLSITTGVKFCLLFYLRLYRYEPGRRDLSECRYNQNEGYVIFSAMGSFFIPMAVMIYVYARISCVIASRHDHMTDISVHNKVSNVCLFSMVFFMIKLMCVDFENGEMKN